MKTFILRLTMPVKRDKKRYNEQMTLAIFMIGFENLEDARVVERPEILRRIHKMLDEPENVMIKGAVEMFDSSSQVKSYVSDIVNWSEPGYTLIKGRDGKIRFCRLYLHQPITDKHRMIDVVASDITYLNIFETLKDAQVKNEFHRVAIESLTSAFFERTYKEDIVFVKDTNSDVQLPTIVSQLAEHHKALLKEPRLGMMVIVILYDPQFATISYVEKCLSSAGLNYLTILANNSNLYIKMNTNLNDPNFHFDKIKHFDKEDNENLIIN